MDGMDGMDGAMAASICSERSAASSRPVRVLRGIARGVLPLDALQIGLEGLILHPHSLVLNRRGSLPRLPTIEVFYSLRPECQVIAKEEAQNDFGQNDLKTDFLFFFSSFLRLIFSSLFLLFPLSSEWLTFPPSFVTI